MRALLVRRAYCLMGVVRWPIVVSGQLQDLREEFAASRPAAWGVSERSDYLCFVGAVEYVMRCLAAHLGTSVSIWLIAIRPIQCLFLVPDGGSRCGWFVFKPQSCLELIRAP